MRAFFMIVAASFILLLVGCGGSPPQFAGEGSTAVVDGGIVPSIPDGVLFDPAACPPGYTLLAVRQEGGESVLYGVEGGQETLRAELGSSAVIPLGEADPAQAAGHEENTLMLTSFDFSELFTCIGHFFSPGQGMSWPLDGANVVDVQSFEEDVATFDFHIPQAEVALLATAGPENNRFLYGQQRNLGICEADDMHPLSPIGSYPECVSALGLHDQMSYWAWARCDIVNEWAAYSQYAAELECQAPGMWMVLAGPNARLDTFYFPGVFGVHTHTPSDLYRYFDDRVGYLEVPPFGWEQGWEGLQAFLAGFTSFAEEYPDNPFSTYLVTPPH